AAEAAEVWLVRTASEVARARNGLPLEAALPRHFRHFHVVVFVPALAAGALRFQMAGKARPLAQRLRILPPDQREPLAVVRAEALHRDETRLVADQPGELAVHRVVVGAR